MKNLETGGSLRPGPYIGGMDAPDDEPYRSEKFSLKNKFSYLITLI